MSSSEWPTSTLSRIVALVGEFFGEPINMSPGVLITDSGADKLAKKRSCKTCLNGKDKIRRKTQYFCKKCSDAVCCQHSKVEYICFTCKQKENPQR